jgi:hypothetical protein
MANKEHLEVLKKGVTTWNEWREKNSVPLRKLADLYKEDPFKADFSGADLGGANLNGADLREAFLRGATLRDADLSGADLSGANLGETNLGDTDLNGADFKNSLLGYSTFANIDLSTVKGLETVQHRGIRSLVANPIEFYSCFISFSSKDHEFAERLHADLQNKGVRCWFAPEDIKTLFLQPEARFTFSASISHRTTIHCNPKPKSLRE